MGREHWLRSFCEEESEHRQLLHWLIEEGLCRPEDFQARVGHAHRLREMGNKWYRADDYRRALHCNLGAIHAVDFTPNEQVNMTDDQRLAVARELLPVLSNLAQVFLKRGDFGNVAKAAHLGLRNVCKLPGDEADVFKAKLRYRRALALGEPGPEQNLQGALEDLREAAQLMPTSAEIRSSLRYCKELLLKEQRKMAGHAKGQEDVSQSEDVPQSHESREREPAPAKLSPALEIFAKCVGRSLAKLLQCWNFLQKARGGRTCLTLSRCGCVLLSLLMVMAIMQMLPPSTSGHRVEVLTDL
ncbi:NMRAL1 [Symbiodinium natans]|uniref:NMRAL1 protein n=1 Tax=Symbiodinium natans TaxID=878477 RepID=A0A812USY3_9DINO|nr:NMRAL1 [Symbiodinium natans]